MSTKKTNQPGDQNPIKGNAQVALVLPPDILKKMGINLGNIVNTNDVQQHSVPEHVWVGNTPIPGSSAQHTNLPPKDKNGENTKKYSSILETAILMKKSVLLSPTFTTTGSYIAGELEMSLSTEQDVEGHFSLNNEPTHHNININQKPLHIARELKQPQNKLKKTSNNDFYKGQSKSVTDSGFMQPNCMKSAQYVPSTPVGAQAIVSDDHTDEAYLSDCSSTNSTSSSPLQNSTDSMNASNSILKGRLQNDLSHIKNNFDQIKIPSSDTQSSSQIKALNREHVANISIPIPVNEIIEKKTCNVKAKEVSSTPLRTTASLESVSVVENDVFNEIDAARQLIELADIINISAANIPIAQEEDMQNMLKDTEKLCLDTDMVQDKPNESTKLQDEFINLDNNEKYIEYHPDVPSDVSIDFIATNIEDHLEGEDEILDNLVKHLDSNDIIESNHQETNASGDSHKISEEIMTGSDCSDIIVSLDDIQLQSMDNSLYNKEKLINLGERSFSSNKQTSIDLSHDKITLQNTYKDCVASNNCYTEVINKDSYTIAEDNNVYDENYMKSAPLTETVSTVECKVTKLVISQESSFPCTTENNIRHCATAHSEKRSPVCKIKKTCQTKLDRYFTVTPNRNGTIMAPKKSVSINKEKVGENTMVLNGVIDCPKATHIRQTNTHSYLCSQGEEKPGGSRIKVYKRKQQKCYSEIKVNICQIENKTINATKKGVINVYSRKAKKSHDVELKIDVKNMQPDLEETKPKFCICGDFGSLIDCCDMYEHIHFWSHRSTNCNAEDIFSIYEDHDMSVVRDSIDKSTWEDDIPQNVCTNSICWNDVNSPECSLLKQDEIRKTAAENEFVEDKAERYEKSKSGLDRGSIATDKIDTAKKCVEINKDNKFRESELCNKEKDPTQPVHVLPRKAYDNIPQNTSSVQLKSKPVKSVESSIKSESIKGSKEKECQEFHKTSTVNVQRDSDSKKRLTLKSALSLNKTIDLVKPSTSAKTEKVCTPNTQPDGHIDKALIRKSSVTPISENSETVGQAKVGEPLTPANSQESRKRPSSGHPDENTNNKRKSLRSTGETVKETKAMEQKTTGNEEHVTSSKVSKKDKNTTRKSMRNTTILSKSYESALVQPKLPERTETGATESQVKIGTVTDPAELTKLNCATTKNKKRKSAVTPNIEKSKGETKISSLGPLDPQTTDIPNETKTRSDPGEPSVSKTSESKRQSRRITSTGTSPDEDSPLIPISKSRKRRTISSGDEFSPICKRRSSMAPSKDNSTCGVCSKVVEEAQWDDHIAKEHGYLAWKDGEPPLNVADEKSVSRRLNEVLKRLGILTCCACGSKRKSLKGYLQHKTKCDGNTKVDSEDNSYKDENRKSSGRVKDNSKPTVKCGVCHETIAKVSWFDHIQQSHDYMAWKDCEDPLDLDNEEEVFRHLYAICKEAGSLICKKCGIQRVYVKKYLDHCRSCSCEIPKEIPEIDQADTTTSDLGDLLSQDIYTCGVCSQKIARKQWLNHKMKEHYNVAWIEGQPPVDSRQTWVIEKMLKEYINAGHKFVCKLCGLKRASRLGFYAHVIVCGKTEEEVDKLKLLCTICEKKYLAIYETQHYGWHKQAEANTLRKELEKEEIEKTRNAMLEESEAFVPGGKRRAATKAIEVIQKYNTDKSERGHVCNICGFEADKRDQLKQHVIKCKKTESQSDNFDVSALGDEESEDDSFSGESENESTESESGSQSDEDGQTARRIRKKPEHQHDNSTRYPRVVSNLTRHLQQSSQEFWRFHLSGDNVYPAWRNSVIELVAVSDVATYMQPVETSCRVKINDEWITFNKFTAMKLKGCCLFVGCSPQAISWAPPRDDSCSNYLAVACHRGMDIPRLGTDQTAAYPGVLQIWDFGTFNKVPEFALGVAHSHGAVWAVDWCPSGAQDPAPAHVKAEHTARMGLLAVACSNGSAYIYSVPYPPSTADGQMPILKLQPVVELRLSMTPERKTCQATSLRWSSQKGHALIVVGYSDGTMAYFDLQNESPLLSTKERDTTVIFPYYDEMILSNSVADVDVYPSMDQDSLAGAVCSGSAAGAVATLMASQPTRLASNVACRSTRFQPLWPAVMVSGDSCVIRTIANEMEWTGHGRSMGCGGIATACLRCACAVFHQPPLLRMMMPHPSGSEMNRRSLASIKVVELKKKRKQAKDDPAPFIEPTTYEEAIQHYGIEFKLDKNLPASLMFGRDGWSPEFPLATVQGLAFCPAGGHHHRLAVATHAGLVFLVDTT